MLRMAEVKTGTKPTESDLPSVLPAVSLSASQPSVPIQESAQDAAFSAISHGGRAVLAPEALAKLAMTRFAAGSVLRLSGSMAALWAIAGVALGSEDWCVVVGLPDAGLLAAAEAGLALDRTVLIPYLDTEVLRVLAGLVDAYALVVIGPLNISGADRRRIEARLRYTGGRLIVFGDWKGARVTVKVSRVLIEGLGENERQVGTLKLDSEISFRGGFARGISAP
jgi:hypothetical protein